MAKLYELQDQLVSIDNILESNTNPDTQDILESAREELLQAIDGKVENILNFMSDCKAKADQLKQEELRLATKRKALENKSEYLKNMIYYLMKTNNQTKANYGTWDCRIAQNPPKIVIDDEQWLPQEFIKVTTTVDKTALKNAMNGDTYIVNVDGKDIQVAHTEIGESLRIK